MKMLLLSLMTICAANTASLAQIAPGVSPDAGQPAPDSMAAPQPLPLDEAQLRERMAASAVGRVAVQAVQGTPYGAAVGVAEFELLLVHRGQVVHRQTGQLDEHGVAVVEGLPVAMEVTPVVQIAYGGVFYQDKGADLTPQSPESKIEVTVYETTDERPQWHITMRHVMIQRNDQGVFVSETVVIANPANSTWLGTPVDDSADAKRDAAQFQLPRGATDVQLQSGFHGWCCTTVDDSGLMSVQMPMMPGQAQYQFSYVLAATNASAAVLVGAPAPIDHMIAFVEDGATVTATGMKDLGIEDMGQGKVHFFQADGVLPGQLAGLTLGNLAAAVDLQATSDANSRIKMYAAVGGALVLLAGVVVIFIKAPRSAPAAN